MWFPWWLRHGALRETWDERTSEFAHFNLAIRLSKVKKLAFFAFHLPVDLLNCGPLLLGNHFLHAEGVLTAVPTSFFSAAQETDKCTWMIKATGAWLFPFSLVSGEVKTVVHLIREDSHSRYMTTCGLTGLGPVMGTTQDLSIMDLNPNVVLFLVFSVFSSTSPPLVPNFMRAPLSR